MRVLKFYVIMILIAALAFSARAEVPPESAVSQSLTPAQRLSLAKEFVSRISKGLASADQKLMETGRAGKDLSNIPDGEILFFRLRLDQKLALDSTIFSIVENGGILVSLKDFISAVQFPITVSPDGNVASGWFIRENRPFELDMAKREVKSRDKIFPVSESVRVEDNDVLVPSDELGRWFGIELDPNPSQLEFFLVSPIKLPIQEQLDRKNRTFSNQQIGPPLLPEAESDRKALDFPFVDVASTSRYSRPGDGGKTKTQNTASVRTSGDFAYGTLFTQSQLDREERLTNLRVNYKKEERDPELLGPLHARRYEIGDVIPVDIPLNDTETTGMGVRVTNADKLRNIIRPSTEITGTNFPGWDVELYREEQLLAVQTVGDDGLYKFDNVDLFSANNNFRLVFYGPQGEVREEEVYVPVDPSRLSQMSSAYDVSIYRQNTQTYRKFKGKDRDEGSPNIVAYYERPLTENLALSAGFSNRQDNGDQKGRIYGGLSTSLYGTILNFNTALDSKGESAGEIVARKDIGKHSLRNETRVSSEAYRLTEPDDQENAQIFTSSTTNSTDDVEIFGNQFSATGPFPFQVGQKPRYNLSLDYSQQADGDQYVFSGLGFSTVWSPISFSEQLTYRAATGGTASDDEVRSLTSVSGNIGSNRLRLTADYEIKPESELDNITANVKRRITPKAELDVSLIRMEQERITEGRAQVNWDAGYANISPGVIYNTENDLTATINTRFGLARDPASGSVKSFDRQVTAYGGVSAFVFLDKNGDMKFGDGDEPISDVIIKAPQNGGREITEEDGRAFFRSMGAMRLTDVFVDPGSLPDPYWISSFEGSAILPREGHVTELEFPIHVGGEIDGTVYARALDGGVYPVLL